MLHRLALTSINMSEELQTIFQVIIRAVCCVGSSPLRGRLFAKLCDDMEAERTILEHTGSLVPKRVTGYLN